MRAVIRLAGCDGLCRAQHVDLLESGVGRVDTSHVESAGSQADGGRRGLAAVGRSRGGPPVERPFLDGEVRTGTAVAVAGIAEVPDGACLFQQVLVLTGVDAVATGALVGGGAGFDDVRSAIGGGSARA